MADLLSTAVDDSGSPSAENGLSHEHNAERSGLPMGPSSCLEQPRHTTWAERF